MLVRPGSEAKLVAPFFRLGDSRTDPRGDRRPRPSPLGLDAGAVHVKRGTDRHFFHLKAMPRRIDHARRRTRSTTSPGRSTRSTSPTTSRPASSTTRPRSPWPAAFEGRFTEDMFDEGQEYAPRPTTRTKFESEKLVRTRVQRGMAHFGHRRSSSATRRTGEMDKIDSPYYFFKAIPKSTRRCRSGCRSTWLEVQLDEHRPGRLRRRRDRPHRPRAGPSTARPSTSSTPAPSAPATCSTRSPAPATPRRWRSASTSRCIDMLPKGVLSYAMKLPALKDIRAHAARRPRDPRRGARAHGARPALRRRATRSARSRTPASRSRRWRRYADEAVGLLGAQPRPRPVQGPLVRRARSTARRS